MSALAVISQVIRSIDDGFIYRVLVEAKKLPPGVKLTEIKAALIANPSIGTSEQRLRLFGILDILLYLRD